MTRQKRNIPLGNSTSTPAVHPWIVKNVGPMQNNVFCKVDLVGASQLEAYEVANAVELPTEFKRFLLDIGDLSIFRLRHYYRGRIFCPTNAPEFIQGYHLLKCGWIDDASLYFRKRDGNEKCDPDAYIVEDRQIIAVLPDFQMWIRNSILALKERYSAKDWKTATGPIKEFSAEEKSIVTARAAFSWKLLEVDASNNATFEICNGSSRRLPYLSIGVKGQSSNGSKFQGAVFLNVSDLEPGQIAIKSKLCYERIGTPESLEFFQFPEFEPHQRDTYWEFRPFTEEESAATD